MSGMTKKEAEELGVKENFIDYFVKFGVNKQNYANPLEFIWLVRCDGGVLKKMR